MKATKVFIMVFSAALIITGICAVGVSAEEQNIAEDEILSKLADIYKTQQDIENQLSDIKQELEIIKIRVTQRQ